LTRARAIFVNSNSGDGSPDHEHDGDNDDENEGDDNDDDGGEVTARGDAVSRFEGVVPRLPLSQAPQDRRATHREDNDGHDDDDDKGGICGASRRSSGRVVSVSEQTADQERHLSQIARGELPCSSVCVCVAGSRTPPTPLGISRMSRPSPIRPGVSENKSGFAPPARSSRDLRTKPRPDGP
jgi:hypothetical protein